MKNKLITELGMDFNRTAMFGFGSSFGLGKTTIFSIMAAEYYHEGKNVLFLTNDMDERTVMKKIKKALKGETPNLNVCSLNVKKFINLEEAFEAQLEVKDFDIVIVDGSLVTEDYNLLRELSNKHKCIVIASIQTQGYAIPHEIIQYPKSITILQKVDMLMSLTTKKEFTFWKNMKYIFFFWLKKPNRTITILKNRYGADGTSIDISVDFDNVKVY
jgi:Ni2+-binding GTPase involved in maturation of urease and hydrogenase